MTSPTPLLNKIKVEVEDDLDNDTIDPLANVIIKQELDDDDEEEEEDFSFTQDYFNYENAEELNIDDEDIIDSSSIVKSELEEGEEDHTVHGSHIVIHANSDGSFSFANEENTSRSKPQRNSVKNLVRSFRINRCLHCDFTSDNEQLLQEHVQKHNLQSVRGPKEVFFCSECRLTTTNRRAYLNHYETDHLQTLDFSCEYCKFVTKEKRVRNSHLSSVHFACSKCDFRGQNAVDVTNHESQEHLKPSKSIPCKYCNKKFDSVELLEKHTSTVHRRKLQCTFCEFSCDASFDFYTHLEQSHKQNFFKCGSCDFTTHLPWQMSDHDGIIHNLKAYACGKCNYTTTRNMFLRRHIKARHMEKSECCPYCPYQSAQRWCVTQHILQVHEKTRLFPCDMCNYKSTSRGNLNVHIRRIHNKDPKSITQC